MAQDFVHSMRNLKRKDFLEIKVDLSKAYNKLSWEFIWRILEEIQLPRKIIDTIMHGVMSIDTNIKWNGATSEFFVLVGDPSRRSYIFSHLCATFGQTFSSYHLISR